MRRSSDQLRIVHIGNLARRAADEFAVLKNYAAFYNELTRASRRVGVFAPFINPGESGYDFLDEVAIDSSIDLTNVPGNTPDSSLRRFVINNLRVLATAIRFTSRPGDYFVFLPSLPGTAALMSLLVTRRYSSLGLYIGGDFAIEQRHERRSPLKRLLKNWGAPLISWGIDRGIRRADYVVTTSPLVHDKYRDCANILMAPPLLNVTEHDLSSHPPARGPTQVRLVYCGELRQAKGVMTLLEAFRLLIDHRRDLELTLRFIGSGHAEAEIRAFVATHHLASHVELVGQVKDRGELSRLLQESFALVLPSFSEGFPRVAYECFTLGVPTLLTPVGGIPLLVRDGEHTLFVATGDPEDIARKVSRLVDEPGLRERLVDRGRALMRDQIFPIIARYGSLARMVEAGVRGEL